MILNAVLVDYLTLTTFDVKDWIQFSRVFDNHCRAIGGKRESHNRMQYGGFRTGHGFIGTGEQKRGWHYMTSYSGQPSHLAYQELLESVLMAENCTRIDVQATIPLPDHYQSETLYQRLSKCVPHGRKVTVYKSKDGLDTIYVGTRSTKNGRVTRIYVKEYVGGRGLRFETEFRKEWAAQHWVYLRTGGELKELLIAELESMGDCLDYFPMTNFYTLVKGYFPAPKPTPVQTSTPTLEWLLNTADPAIRRMLHDHDHGWKTRKWLRGLLSKEH